MPFLRFLHEAPFAIWLKGGIQTIGKLNLISMKQRLHSLSWKCLFVLAATLCLSSSSYSQEEARNNTEAGIKIGPMVFLGDLGGHAGKSTTFIKDYNMGTTQLSICGYFSANSPPWPGFPFSLNYIAI